MPLKIVTQPQSEPITLAEAKQHLRYEDTDEDLNIGTMIGAAREQAEAFTGRAIMTQTLDLYLDEFPRVIALPRSPVQSVTSIEYVDTAGATQTLDASAYRVDAISEPGRITPVDSWPATDAVTNAVKVRFVAGYASINAVPKSFKAALFLTVGDMFEHRESIVVGSISNTLPQSAESLLWPYKVIA